MHKTIFWNREDTNSEEEECVSAAKTPVLEIMLVFLFLQNNREKLLLHWAKWSERRMTGWPHGLGGMRGKGWEHLLLLEGASWSCQEWLSCSWGSAPYPSSWLHWSLLLEVLKFLSLSSKNQNTGWQQGPCFCQGPLTNTAEEMAIHSVFMLEILWTVAHRVPLSMGFPAWIPEWIALHTSACLIEDWQAGTAAILYFDSFDDE